MSRRLQYIAENQDPEIEAELRPVLFKVLRQQIAEINEALEAEDESPFKVDLRSASAGKQWLTQERGKISIAASRKRFIIESLGVISAAQGLLAKPRRVAEEEKAAAAQSQEDQAVADLIAAAKGNLAEAKYREVAEKYGDTFNVAIPRSTDDDEEEDE